jgi:hypothetical protein
MRVPVVAFLVSVVMVSSPALAQEPPPRIPFVVVDLHANVPRFPSDANLAASRDLQIGELPGTGFGGGDIGLHLYPLRWRAITFGVGGQVTRARAQQTPATVPGQPLRPVAERFTTISPQLSFNFGSGSGWSYLSGGIGVANWSIVPDGATPLAADEERLRTTNYGGGARWFIKPHLAFSFDVRFYAINPGTPAFGFPGSPRTTLLIIGAGVSLK